MLRKLETNALIVHNYGCILKSWSTLKNWFLDLTRSIKIESLEAELGKGIFLKLPK